MVSGRKLGVRYVMCIEHLGALSRGENLLIGIFDLATKLLILGTSYLTRLERFFE